VITYFGVGPKLSSFPRRKAAESHSSSGRITALALGADGNRLYAGSHAGVWRSDDAGENWYQLTYPQPTGVLDVDIPGALFAPHIKDIATSPTVTDVLLACALDSQFEDGRDGVYRSEDGGAKWTLVLKSTSVPTPTPFNVVFAPDDPQLVYAVGTQTFTPFSSFGIVAISRDAGKTWATQFVGRSLWHTAVGPLESDGRTRRIYAVGDKVIWYSSDGGQTWGADAGVATITTARQQLHAFQVGCDPLAAGVGEFAGAIAYAAGAAPQMLAVEPGSPWRIYLAADGGANGPTYYSPRVPDGTPVNTNCKRLAGEASLWIGDFSQFAHTGGAQWTQLPGPPVYSGVTTPSGNCFVVAKPTSTGFLVFFSDCSHLHVSAGTPTDNAAWHRLDGMDASEAKRQGLSSNQLFMHLDPHAVAFTPNFEITLKAPSGVADPYDRNSELDQHIAGRIWTANDGGVYWCDDGGKTEQSWQMPVGLETIDPINVAGLFGLGHTPALYFGCGDNNDFFSRDGGEHWGDPGSACGDCDAWFTDSARADRVVQFVPRQADPSGFVGLIGIVSSDGSEYPNAADDGSKTFVPSTKLPLGTPRELKPYAASGIYLAGYRPLIKTLPTELPLPDVDYVTVEQDLAGNAVVLRTTKLSAISKVDDWHDAAKAQQIGPALPTTGLHVVQASGGHARPVYFVGDILTQFVWKSSPDQTAWVQIVPNAPVGSPEVKPALAWFVNPYDPIELFVLDSDGMKISADGGASWIFDAALTTALTGGGKLTISPSLLQDMQFSRGEGGTRFAMGTAGVLCTMDFGVTWFPVLNAVAIPGRPESAFFDPLSDPTDRTVYVECEGRSILRVGGLPELPPFEAAQPIDLMDFAALDY
jgi:hypothetical protein